MSCLLEQTSLMIMTRVRKKKEEFLLQLVLFLDQYWCSYCCFNFCFGSKWMLLVRDGDLGSQLWLWQLQLLVSFGEHHCIGTESLELAPWHGLHRSSLQPWGNIKLKRLTTLCCMRTQMRNQPSKEAASWIILKISDKSTATFFAVWYILYN